MLEKFQLDGKVALITGGSSGIGKAIAIALANAGADIIIASRKQERLEEARIDLEKTGREVLTVPANVRHLDEIDNLVNKSVSHFGHIDVVVNNAGTNLTYGSAFDIDEISWDIVMGLNLKGYFFLSQSVGKVMCQNRRGGAIINLASEAGISPIVGMGAYSISKAGVIMLTQVLAQEWGQYNIRVNAIAPGLIKTKLSKALLNNELYLSEKLNNTALGRISEPEEMTGAVLFLASDAASYVTGQTLSLDGGIYPSVQNLLKTLNTVDDGKE